MVINMRNFTEISPTLKEILCHLDEDYISLINACPGEFVDMTDAFNANDVEWEDGLVNCEAWRYNRNGEANERQGADTTSRSLCEVVATVFVGVLRLCILIVFLLSQDGLQRKPPALK